MNQCIDIDELYRIASLINVTPTFTETYLQELLAVDLCSKELDFLIGKLVRRGLLSVSDQAEFVFDDTAPEINTVTVHKYQLVADRQDEFEQYLRELRRERVQPEQDGKPRGLCYRRVEDYIKNVIKKPEAFEDAETRAEIDDRVEQYLAAAEAEEISNPGYQLHQKKVSEAYLRELYGSYLQAKREWLPTVQQYLRAGLLFLQHGNAEKKDFLEFRIIKLLSQLCDDLSDKESKAILTQVEYMIADSTGDYAGTYTTLLRALSGINNPLSIKGRHSLSPTSPLAGLLEDEKIAALASNQKEITTDSRQVVVAQATQDTDAFQKVQSSFDQEERDSSIITSTSLFNEVPTTSSPTGYSESASSQKDQDMMSDVVSRLQAVLAA